jgi:hypothetical protein
MEAAHAAAHLQESTRKIKGLWDQIQSTLKSLQLVVAAKTKEDKHMKAAFELRVESQSRVVEILTKEKASVLEGFRRAGGNPGVSASQATTPAEAEFWARMGELDASLQKVRSLGPGVRSLRNR